MRAQEARGPAGTKEMGKIEIDRLSLSAETAFEIAAIVRRIFGGHGRGGLGLAAKVEDLAARLRVRDVIAAVRPLADLRGSPAHAVFGAMLADRAEPGLVDELEEAGRAGGARPRIRVEAAFQ